MNQPPTENELRARVASNINDLEATYQLGELLRLKGDFKNAEIHARNAVLLAPNQAESQKLLGLVFSQTGRSQAGAHHLRKALELASSDAILLASLALNLSGQGRYEEASEYFSKALELQPNNVRFIISQANAAELDQRLDEAWELLDQAERLNADTLETAMVRADVLARRKHFSEALSTLDAKGKQAETNTNQMPSYKLRRARLLDKLERYEEAFDECSRAKQCMQEQGMVYQGALAKKHYERFRQFFTRQRMQILPRAELREHDSQPLFVIGFPRSGTTLVEQILASHPEVQAGGELSIVDRLCATAENILGGPMRYPECLIEATMGDRLSAFKMLRDYYLQESRLCGISQSGTRFFTDKTPFNGPHLGLIRLLFPHAPIIEVLRHPLDTVVSTFFMQMNHGYGMACDLKAIAEHYLLVFNLIEHYREHAELNCLQIRYEDIVSNQREQTALLLQHAGLDWDDRCSEFHRFSSTSRTASYAQVTEKIYAGSVGRYKNYAKQLAPIVPVLEPLIERLGYSIDC